MRNMRSWRREVEQVAVGGSVGGWMRRKIRVSKGDAGTGEGVLKESLRRQMND